MSFPFSVEFNRSLKAEITHDNQQKILQYISQIILRGKADNIVVEDLSVTYSGSTANGRQSLFASIDNGTFGLTYKNGRLWLNYRINVRKLFIRTAILSSTMGAVTLVSGGPWLALGFLLLCSFNWIIDVIRHEIVATDIATGIDKLICGKEAPVENKEEDDKLKSWF